MAEGDNTSHDKGYSFVFKGARTNGIFYVDVEERPLDPIIPKATSAGLIKFAWAPNPPHSNGVYDGIDYSNGTSQNRSLCTCKTSLKPADAGICGGADLCCGCKFPGFGHIIKGIYPPK
ncbi:MAG: hypothetical protein MMC23_007677 [Stictis urceolatum]|nr:hypothetical protein [Stictis urceolata]